jgi:hypothetical protein
MTKKEKQEVIGMPTIAYFSGFGGVEIKSIDYVDEAVVFVANAWYGSKSAHRSIVRYSRDGAPYFMAFGCKIRLADCMRV